MTNSIILSSNLSQMTNIKFETNLLSEGIIKIPPSMLKSVYLESDHFPVLFTNYINSRIQVRPKYYELGFSDRSEIFGRSVILSSLIGALEYLPPQYGFRIWDIYRPRQVQGRLFEWMKGEVRKLNPLMNEDEIYIEARKYMSPPSQVGDEYCPPHLSGGAIDLTLYDVDNGSEVEMGTVFDDCTDRAHSLYFNSLENLSAEENLIRLRRDMLRGLMLSAGFTTYAYEWWHYDLGDIFWSKQTGQPAIFDALFGDSEWPE